MARERGVTLVELLVVVVLLAFLALLGTAQLTHMVQKNQLASAARDITAFLQSVPDLVAQHQSPLFVRFRRPSAGQAWFEISRDLAGTQILRRLEVSKVVAFDLNSLSAVDSTWPRLADDLYALRCDTFNRATDPNSLQQLNGPGLLVLTHENMVTGKLRPKYGLVVRVAPVWAAAFTRTPNYS